MAGKTGGTMDTIKVGMRVFEVGMRFMNNLGRYQKNAEVFGKISNKLFGKKEAPVDVGMYSEKEKPAPKRVSKGNPLLDRMISDKTFSEFLDQIFDKKNVFGNLPDSWVIQQNLIDKYEELSEYETMGDLRLAVKKLLKK